MEIENEEAALDDLDIKEALPINSWTEIETELQNLEKARHVLKTLAFIQTRITERKTKIAC